MFRSVRCDCICVYTICSGSGSALTLSETWLEIKLADRQEGRGSSAEALAGTLERSVLKEWGLAKAMLDNDAHPLASAEMWQRLGVLGDARNREAV